MSHVTMHNRIPDVIGALLRQEREQPVLAAYHAAQRTKELIPTGTWQKALQASIYVATPEGSDYQDAANAYCALVIATLEGLVIHNLVNLTYHTLADLAEPLPPHQPGVGALVTSCANPDRLNQVGVEPIGSTFWDDLAAQIDPDEVVDAGSFAAAIEEAVYG